MRKKPPKRSSSPLPRGAHFDTVSALFSFRASGTLKKGGPGGPSKLDAFFCPFGGLPGGPQEGSLCSDSSILTFAAGPQKGSKMEPKWSHFGSPRGHYTHFGGNFFAQKASSFRGRLQGIGRGGRGVHKTDCPTPLPDPPQDHPEGRKQQEGNTRKKTKGRKC